MRERSRRHKKLNILTFRP